MQISEKELKSIIVEILKDSGLDEIILSESEYLKALTKSTRKSFGRGRGADTQSTDITKKLADKFKDRPKKLSPTQRRVAQNREREKEKRRTDLPRKANQDTPASSDQVAPVAVKEPTVSVFKGKGTSIQSQLTKAGLEGKEKGNLLKALRADLTAAGFKVLEQAATAKKEIRMDKTFKAVSEIADEQKQKAAIQIITQMIRDNNLQVVGLKVKQGKITTERINKRSK